MNTVKVVKDGRVVFEIPESDFPVTLSMGAVKYTGEAYEKSFVLRVTYFRDEGGAKQKDKPKGMILQ